MFDNDPKCLITKTNGCHYLPKMSLSFGKNSFLTCVKSTKRLLKGLDDLPLQTSDILKL